MTERFGATDSAAVDIAVLVSTVQTLSRDVQVLRDDIKRLGMRLERLENMTNQQNLTLMRQNQFFELVEQILRQGKA